jgi:NAD(P)H-hydrate epimerase
MTQALTSDKLKTFYHLRMPESHKGTFGHAFLVAGMPFKMGAAVIAARACLRGGCGLLSVSVPSNERSILQVALPEAMLHDRSVEPNYKSYDALGVGPAIGLTRDAELLFKQGLDAEHPTMIVDADAISLLALHPEWLDLLPPQTILTPHVKEFDRLLGTSLTMEEREEKAKEFAAHYNFIVVLKQHRTLITDGENSFRNTTGNTGLAKGGSGDALFGLITSLRAQGYNALQAAMLGVYLHGLAADLALTNQSEESVLITDIIEHFGEAFRRTFE